MRLFIRKNHDNADDCHPQHNRCRIDLRESTSLIGQGDRLA